MAETFNKSVTPISDTAATCYTVPASTTAIVIGFAASNTTAAEIAVTASVSGSVYGNALPIPANSTLSLLDGKIVMQAGESVEIQADTASCGNLFLSVLEVS